MDNSTDARPPVALPVAFPPVRDTLALSVLGSGRRFRSHEDLLFLEEVRSAQSGSGIIIIIIIIIATIITIITIITITTITTMTIIIIIIIIFFFIIINSNYYHCYSVPLRRLAPFALRRNLASPPFAGPSCNMI